MKWRTKSKERQPTNHTTKSADIVYVDL